MSELFESIPMENVKPKRYLASHSPNMGKKSLTQETLVEKESSETVSESVGVNQKECVDPMEFLESFDVLNSLGKNFYQDLVGFYYFICLLRLKDKLQMEGKKRSIRISQRNVGKTSKSRKWTI